MNSEDYKIAYENVMIANKMLEQEIERLTELCNKYEEEHNTTFETWQKDIKENKLLHSIIKEVREEMENAKYISVNDEYHIMEHEKKLLEILDKENK